MSKENKKTNVFKQILKSVKDLDKYEDFALELPKVVFKYFLKLVLFFSIIIAIVYTFKIVNSAKEIYNNVKAKTPDFSYVDGNLTMESEESIIINDYEETFGKIIIDTKNTALNENNEKFSIIILKDKCIINSIDNNRTVTYNYQEIGNQYNIIDFTKQSVTQYFETMNPISIYASIYFVIFIYLFIVYFISIFIDVLILWVLAYLVSRISRMKLKGAPLFGIAVHSITLSVILNLIYIVVNLFTGFYIKYFSLMYSTISYIYVIVAILMIKADYINRQAELIKLAKEQEKIKEELERKEKEKQEKEKQPKEEKNKNKNKKRNEDGEIEGDVNPSTIQENK